MSNLKIWDFLSKTDPDHTKAFSRAGGFKGTSVKPIYCDRKMTEQFGPCGEGWGINEPKFEIVTANNEILVYCIVGVWWGNASKIVYGVGGDKVLVSQSAGLRTSDEAFKMSFTDAVGNAYKRLGMSADVHMGLFDDDKYVRSVREELHPKGGAKDSPLPSSTTGEIHSDWPAWIESFKSDFNAAPGHLAAQEVWHQATKELSGLKAYSPSAYSALKLWVTETGKKKPKEAA